MRFRSSRFAQRLDPNARSGLLSSLSRRLHLEELEARCLLSAVPSTSYFQVSANWFTAAATQTQQISTTTTLGTNATGGDSAANAASSPWIVRLTEDAAQRAGGVDGAAALLSDLPIQVVRGLGLPGQLLVMANGAEILRQNPLIASVEQDQTITATAAPNDPLYATLTALNNTGQAGGVAHADISAEQAWDITTGSSNVVVAIIDTGVDYTHSDLAANIWTNPGEVGLDSTGHDKRANGIDDDQDGFVDDVHGYDFHNNDGDPMDDSGHGTHVAGTIGAVGNNNLGVTGVSWTTSIMPLKFLDQNNRGSTADAIRAINYATMMRTSHAANVRVLNNSWGQLGGFSSDLYMAIQTSEAADILFVAAAGNGDVLGRGINTDLQPFYPAAYDLNNIISVAAADGDDRLARFSNYGVDTVDLAAPGVGILSTSPGEDYISRNGTSMAAPHVSGVAALLAANTPNATMSEIRQAILESVDPLPALANRVGTGGRLNAYKALVDDTFRPTATLLSAPNITQAGGTFVPITVQYADNQAVNVASIDGNDLQIVRRFSSGQTFSATLQQVDQNINGANRVAVYRMAAPSGAWQSTDTGIYDIYLQASEVTDVPGNAARSILLGSFQIEITVEGTLRVNSFVDSVDANLGDNLGQDDQGRSTLRAAIQEANRPGNRFVIFLGAGEYDLTLPGAGEDAAVSGDLDITGEMTIVGQGANWTTIDAKGLDRVFDIRPGGVLTLVGVNVSGGISPTGTDGGGILNQGQLTLNKSSVAGNRGANGGGIASRGPLTIDSSTISGNTATQDGGGIHNTTAATITRSTLSGNNATSQGGGLFNSATATLDMSSSTVAKNVVQGLGNIAPFQTSTNVGIFVSHGSNIIKFDLQGNFQGQAGSNYGSGGPFGQNNFYTQSMAFGPDGMLYAADRTRSMVVRIDPVTMQKLSEYYVGNTAYGGFPVGIAFDSQGRTFVLKGQTNNHNNPGIGEAVDVYVNGVVSQAGFITNLPGAQCMEIVGNYVIIGEGDVNGFSSHNPGSGVGIRVFDVNTGVEIAGSPFGSNIYSTPLATTTMGISRGPDIGGGPNGAPDGVPDIYMSSQIDTWPSYYGYVAAFSGTNFSLINPDLFGALNNPQGMIQLPTGELVIAEAGHVDVDPREAHLRKWAGSGQPLTYFGTYVIQGSNQTNDLEYWGPTGLLDAGGGVFAEQGSTARVNNSVVAGNSGATKTADVTGRFISSGYNLVGEVGTAAGFTVSTDIASPTATNYLGPLQDNGGPTKTHDLMPGSPAIDAGSDTVAGHVDQRGQARGQDGNNDGIARDDIGAVERYFVEVQGVRYHDLNGNGIHDAGEPGLVGQTVYIDTNHNGQLDVDEPSQLTKSDDATTTAINEAGTYRFGNLPPGSYTVAEVSAAGWSVNQPSIYAASSATDMGAVGQPKLVRVADFNNDGLQDLAIFNDALPRMVLVYLNNGAGGFMDPIQSVYGSLLQDAAIGDLNGDGFLDIVTTDPSLFSGGVTVLLGDGDGHFADQPKMEFAQAIRGVTLGDFDSDGDLDLAVANESAQSIVVMRNDGTGFFGNAQAYSVAAPYYLTSADLNRDGVLDLVVSSFNRTSFAILLGSGNGAFAAPVTISVAKRIARLEAVDLDNDGDLDLVGINRNDGTVLIFANFGNATFATARTFSVGSLPEMISVGDLDSDGDFDLAIPNSGSNQVSVLRNLGDGSFAPAVQLSLSGAPSRIALADVNQDGALDLAAVLSGTNQVVVLPSSKGVYETTLGPGGALLGADFADQPLPGRITGQMFNDLNKDGVKDPGENGLAGWTVYVDADDDGVLDVSETRVITDSNGLYALDNLPALVTYSIGVVPQSDWQQTTPSAADHRRWSVNVNAAAKIQDIDFGAYFLDPGGQALSGVLQGWVFSDTNNNGARDVGELGIVGQMVYIDNNNNGVFDGTDISRLTMDDDQATTGVNERGMYQFKNLGPANYTVRPALATGASLTSPRDLQPQKATISFTDIPQAVALGDMDGVNGLDLVIAVGNVVSIVPNQGNGTFGSPRTLSLGANAFGAISVAVANLDGVNGLDIVATNYYSNTISVLLQNANGTFKPAVNYSVKTFPHSVRAIDLNHDSFLDLVVANEWNSNLSILLNNGSGAFAAQGTFPATGASPFSIVAGQFNDDTGDGQRNSADHVDFAVANFDSNTVSIMRGNGTGGFTSAQVSVGTGPSCVATGDVNGDGYSDVVVSNFLSDNVMVLLNNGSGVFTKSQTAPAGTGPYSCELADLDLDGDLDMIVTNGTSDHLAVLRNDGHGNFGLPQNFAVAVFPDSISFASAAGDLNRDGIPDLAVVNGEARTVSVLNNALINGAQRATLVGTETKSGLDFGVRTITNPPGDYDGNGSVQQGDYVFWREHFGETTGAGLAADGNKNNGVDAADYVFWRKYAGPSGADPLTTTAQNSESLQTAVPAVSESVPETAVISDAVFVIPRSPATAEKPPATFLRSIPPAELGSVSTHERNTTWQQESRSFEQSGELDLILLNRFSSSKGTDSIDTSATDSANVEPHDFDCALDALLEDELLPFELAM